MKSRFIKLSYSDRDLWFYWKFYNTVLAIDWNNQSYFICMPTDEPLLFSFSNFTVKVKRHMHMCLLVKRHRCVVHCEISVGRKPATITFTVLHVVLSWEVTLTHSEVHLWHILLVLLQYTVCVCACVRLSVCLGCIYPLFCVIRGTGLHSDKLQCFMTFKESLCFRGGSTVGQDSTVWGGGNCLTSGPLTLCSKNYTKQEKQEQLSTIP